MGYFSNYYPGCDVYEIFPPVPEDMDISEEDWYAYCQDMEEMRAEYYRYLERDEEEEVLPF
ncbi:MAG: hypothetical protein J6Y83_04810 [Bacteroidales bacterium]|nr:hypothetical protein [Bacteroidales bacterium]